MRRERKKGNTQRREVDQVVDDCPRNVGARLHDNLGDDLLWDEVSPFEHVFDDDEVVCEVFSEIVDCRRLGFVRGLHFFAADRFVEKVF